MYFLNDNCSRTIFTHSLTKYVSSLIKPLFMSVAHLKNWFVCLFPPNDLWVFVILDSSFFSRLNLLEISLPSVTFLFNCLMESLINRDSKLYSCPMYPSFTAWVMYPVSFLGTFTYCRVLRMFPYGIFYSLCCFCLSYLDVQLIWSLFLRMLCNRAIYGMSRPYSLLCRATLSEIVPIIRGCGLPTQGPLVYLFMLLSTLHCAT